MTTVYSDFSRDRIGWFFGLTGPQLAVLSVGLFPALWAFNEKQWGLLFGFAAGWVLLFVLVVVPIRGRSATGWLTASLAHAIGLVFRWSSWRSHASRGQADDLGVPDLPGVLHGIRVHDGPPQGPSMSRVAVVQDKANRVWAVTAAITHPGLALADGDERARQGRGLTDLLNACARTELITEVIFVVRSVPDDGAERDQWLTRHLRTDAPTLARTVNEQLSQVLSQAAVRTEAYVTIVAPEARLAKEAKEFGRGIDARARAMLMLAGEVESHLRAGMRVTGVEWLTSPQLAAAVRTGFAPGDRAGIIEALAAREAEPGVNADVPWAQAGPSGADAVVRHYSHDAWNSVSATVKLPARGAVIGALAPVLVPTEPGERRSLMVAFPILAASTADRQTANAEWAADMGETLRTKAGVKTRAREQQAAARTRGLDAKLASGHALVRPYAVATVTVPKTARIAEYGRRLDAAIRRSGFAPLRLDLAQDAGFAASTIPLGLSLTRKVEGA